MTGLRKTPRMRHVRVHREYPASVPRTNAKDVLCRSRDVAAERLPQGPVFNLRYRLSRNIPSCTQGGSGGVLHIEPALALARRPISNASVSITPSTLSTGNRTFNKRTHCDSATNQGQDPIWDQRAVGIRAIRSAMKFGWKDGGRVRGREAPPQAPPE